MIRRTSNSETHLNQLGLQRLPNMLIQLLQIIRVMTDVHVRVESKYVCACARVCVCVWWWWGLLEGKPSVRPIR